MKKKLLSLVVLLVLIGSVTVYANSEVVEMLKSNIKVLFNGKELDMRDANGEKVDVFIYNGTTYLPVRAISNALDVPVDWDGITQSVLLGEQLSGKIVKLKDLTIITSSDSFYDFKNFTSLVGKNYYDGFETSSWENAYREYLLNGEYKTFKCKIMPKSYWLGEESKNLGVIRFSVDGVEKKIVEVISDNIEPIEVEIDLTNALRFKIDEDLDENVGIIEPYVITK